MMHLKKILFPLAALCLLLASGMAAATNVHVINDPRENLGFLSGYDIKSVTFTLDAGDSLTISIEPYGVPGDTDGDGNPNASSTSGIIDEPGVGSLEFLRMGLVCNNPSVCVPDANFIYNNNTLTVLGTTDAVSMSITASAYVITIPNFTQFKTNLGGTTTDFGAFTFSASFADAQVDDFAPDLSLVGQPVCEAISLEPPVVGKTPFECYAINKVTIKDKTGTTGDTIKVEKAGFRLAAGDSVDLATDMVQIRLDGLAFDFPAGSFVQKGSKPDYVFKSASGVKPQIEARLRFDKKQWELKVEDGDASLIDNSNGVDVALMINGFESSENVILTPKSGGVLEYKRNPKTRCSLPTDSDSSAEAIPGTNKLSCLASLSVQHSSGTVVTKTTAAADLLHPNTVFTDDGTGDMAIIHTSCSACLRCGDVYGNFSIVEISGVLGDKMSRVCGVPDASCSLLAP